jgi:hypothetical protein
VRLARYEAGASARPPMRPENFTELRPALPDAEIDPTAT